MSHRSKKQSKPVCHHFAVHTSKQRYKSKRKQKTVCCTVCIGDLDLTQVEENKLILFGSLLTTIVERNKLGASWAIVRIDWSLKSNRQIKLSLPESLVHTVYFLNQNVSLVSFGRRQFIIHYQVCCKEKINIQIDKVFKKRFSTQFFS